MLLRCVSHVGNLALGEPVSADPLHEAELARGQAKVCARNTAKGRRYDVSDENDILLHHRATDLGDITALVERTVIAAWEIRRTMNTGEVALAKRPRRARRSAELAARVDGMVGPEGLSWIVDGAVVEVPMARTARKHRIDLCEADGLYVLRTQASGSSAFAHSKKEARRLSYRSWHWIALSELVDFLVKERGRLIGTIEQPKGSADDLELRMYVEALARECDRAEYVVTGRDLR